jgi:hypothetical protein
VIAAAAAATKEVEWETVEVIEDETVEVDGAGVEAVEVETVVVVEASTAVDEPDDEPEVAGEA